MPKTVQSDSLLTSVPCFNGPWGIVGHCAEGNRALDVLSWHLGPEMTFLSVHSQLELLHRPTQPQGAVEVPLLPLKGRKQWMAPGCYKAVSPNASGSQARPADFCLFLSLSLPLGASLQTLVPESPSHHPSPTVPQVPTCSSCLVGSYCMFWFPFSELVCAHPGVSQT